MASLAAQPPACRVAEVKAGLCSFAFSQVASVSITIHSQAKGSIQTLPSGEGLVINLSFPFSPETKSYWFYFLKLSQILVCPVNHLHCYQLSPNQGHLNTNWIMSFIYAISLPLLPRGFPAHSVKSNSLPIAQHQIYDLALLPTTLLLFTVLQLPLPPGQVPPTPGPLH